MKIVIIVLIVLATCSGVAYAVCCGVGKETERGKLAGSIAFIATFILCCKKPRPKQWYEDRGPYVVSFIEGVTGLIGGSIIVCKRKIKIHRYRAQKEKNAAVKT